MLRLSVLNGCVLCAYAWSAATFPNPMINVDSCGRPGLKGWVCDPDGLLQPESLNVIEGNVRAIFDAKEPFKVFSCGSDEERWQVAVAITTSVDGSGSAAQKTEEFAKQLHNDWGVGSKCGGGALLVLSVRDRQVYISSGKAALEHLTTSRVLGILERMKPTLRAGHYGPALEQAVVEMGLFLSEAESTPESDDGASSGEGWLVGAIMCVAAGIMGMSWWRGRNEQKNFNSVKVKLLKMQQDLRDAHENKYLSTTCPICLEDFEAPKQGSAIPHSTNLGAGESEPLLSDDAPSTSNAAAASAMRGGSEADSIDPAKINSALDAGTTIKQAGDADKRPKAPFLLPCGHTFCEPCVMKWLENHTACPVCRKPADGSKATDGSTTRPAVRPPAPGDTQRDAQESARRPGPRSCQQSYGVNYIDRPYLGQAAYMDEFAFRMMMMRRRYPQFITPGMEHDMVTQAAEGGNIDWVHHRDFLARNPELRAERARQGASSSSISFGGGRSAGGAGGSW